MGTNYRYTSSRRPKRFRRKLLGLMALLAIAAMSVMAFRASRPNDSPAVNSGSKTSKTAKGPQAESLSGKYLFSGTIVLARAVERLAAGNYDQPFSGLHTFNPDAYDAWMADLECPVTTSNVSYQQQVASLVFNCRPEFLPSMAKYFKLVNLAGNHTRDMGADGFDETVQHLEKAGIVPIGNYSPRVKEDICEVVSLPIRIQKDNKTEEKAALPVAFCAWHYFTFTPEAGEMETVQKYAEVMPVFAFIHAGPEYYAEAHPGQVEIAHRLIDLGAEFVIGNSPHWVQNSEAYKGKLIAYSTGNFIFDQIDYETKRGVSISADMEVTYDDNVSKWLALAGQCAARHDNCLETAKSQGLQKIGLKLSYDAIGNTSGAGVVTKKADAVLQKAIEERLNWAQTLKGLNQ